MTTTTLLVVVGSLVGLKTLAFVAYVLRRNRRQRSALEAAAEAVAVAEAAVPLSEEELGWRLQWAEPGVMLVENSSDSAAAREVELTATLTTSAGVAASLEKAVRFVGTGACFTARFGDLERWLDDAVHAVSTTLGRDREQAWGRLACTLSYSMSWLTPDGERRRETRTAQSVVPVPDLALETA